MELNQKLFLLSKVSLSSFFSSSFFFSLLFQGPPGRAGFPVTSLSFTCVLCACDSAPGLNWPGVSGPTDTVWVQPGALTWLVNLLIGTSDHTVLNWALPDANCSAVPGYFTRRSRITDGEFWSLISLWHSRHQISTQRPRNTVFGRGHHELHVLCCPPTTSMQQC